MAHPAPTLASPMASTTEPPSKRPKFSRSRTACLQCRQRKSRCGAVPPHACPNCVDADLPCAWPTLDGRSSKARLQRYRNVGAVGTGVSSTAYVSANNIGREEQAPQAQTQVHSWLDRLLAPTVEPVPVSDPSADVGPMFQLLDPLVWAVSESDTCGRTDADADAETNKDVRPSTQTRTGKPGPRRRSYKAVKVEWWRPHGQTAITPGLKKYSLRVRVTSSEEETKPRIPKMTKAVAAKIPAPRPISSLPLNPDTDDLIGPDGMPSAPIMRHLLDVFMQHFGCQFPFVDQADLERKIADGTGSVFLLLSIAAIAARFSSHPAIALPGIHPHARGALFYARAKTLLGSMLGFPRRETVAAFVLLSHVGFAADSECEVWMLAGAAARMAIDCGLHLAPSPEAALDATERRLDRLVFWSVLLVDYALAFGVGRQTAFRPDDITQALPTQEDVVGKERSPFPFAARLILAYGPLINALNRANVRADAQEDAHAHAARAAALSQYNRLPTDMQWSVPNLQRCVRARQGPIFLHLHLWMHTIIASGYLTGSGAGSGLLRRQADQTPTSTPTPTQTTATAGTSTTAANSLWRNSARTIGDILVLADLIDPHAYFALPFTNQAWFVAACCYLKEIEQQQGELGAAPDHSKTPTPKSEDQDTITDPMDVDADPNPPAAVAASRTLLASVATTNITTLQQGLSKLAEYWYGAEWIAGALAQRVQGIQERDVDLVSVREGFDSFVSVPDGGVVAAAQVEGEGDGEGEEGEGDEGEEGEDDDEDAEVATVDPAVDPTVVAATPTAPPPAEPEPPAALDFLSLPLPFDLTSDADLFSAWVQTHA